MPLQYYSNNVTGSIHLMQVSRTTGYYNSYLFSITAVKFSVVSSTNPFESYAMYVPHTEFLKFFTVTVVRQAPSHT